MPVIDNKAPKRPLAKECISYETLPTLRAEAGQCTILYVEENKGVPSVLGKWFALLQLHVTLVSDGIKAVEACEKTRVDIIFLDIKTPPIGGIDTAHQIRTRPSSQNHSTPIIALSDPGANHMTGSGINAFLLKPINIADVINVINTWLGRVDGEVEEYPVINQHSATHSISPPKLMPLGHQRLAVAHDYKVEAASPDQFHKGVSRMIDLSDRVCRPIDQNSSHWTNGDRRFISGNSDQLSEPTRDHSTILIVAHDLHIQQELSDIQSFNTTVHQAYDKQGCVTMVQLRPFDVILVDASNDRDGCTVCMIRMTQGPNRLAPIIAINKPDGPTNLINQGYNDLLVKPFSKKDLILLIEKWKPFLPSLYESSRQSSRDAAAVFRSLGYTDRPAQPNRNGSDYTSPPHSQASSHITHAHYKEDHSLALPQIMTHVKSPIRNIPLLDIGSTHTHRNSLSRIGADLTGRENHDEQQPYRKKRTRSEPRIDKRQKVEVSRISHNQKERSRRQDISDAVTELRKIVPNCNEKTDKATVLRATVDYMHSLILLVTEQNLLLPQE